MIASDWLFCSLNSWQLVVMIRWDYNSGYGLQNSCVCRRRQCWLCWFLCTQALTSKEYRSFKKHFADLSDGIQNPTSLANRMFSADLLSRYTRRRISELPLTEQKVSTLLDVTETMISLDPQNFYKFVDELEKDSPMQHLCDKLRSTCGERDNHHKCLSTFN